MRVERTIFYGAARVTLDLTTQVIALDVPEYVDARRAPPPDAPRPSPGGGGFVSAALLTHKLKQVDDGVRAAVELLLQRGAGRLPARRLLLARLADRLARAAPPARGDAVEVVLAACRLGGVEATVPPGLRRAVDARVREHLAQPHRSRPVGFYSWSPELARAFQQDRMLQTRLADPAAIAAVARAIGDDPALRATYRAHGRLDRRLAGRRVLRDLTGAIAPRAGRAPPAHPALFPASGSVEQRLARARVPDVFAALIAGVRDATIDLRPPPRPSWKDLQVWALEPLLRPDLAPEAPRLRLSASYRGHLDALFRASLALVRETHIKQEDVEEECEEDEGGALSLGLAPGLTVEPLATRYARAAEAQRFLRGLLDEHFGGALDRVARERPWSPPTRSLREELVDIESLLRGAAETSRRELGISPDPGAAGDVAAFAAWSANRARDPDVGADARMMVPVSHDLASGLTRVWAFLGWESTAIEARFATPPLARVDAAKGSGRAPKVHVYFTEETHAADTPVVVELWVREVLDRDAFRRLCDRHRTAARIARALQR
jgi:hypothetical protein